MNIYDYALQMESESEDYYRQLAQKTDNKGLKTIFNMLGDEESKHYRVIENMKDRVSAKVSDTGMLSDARDVFRRMAGEKGFDFSAEQKELYKKAQEIEQKSKNFYLQKVDEVENSFQKRIFRDLAAEEKKHFFLLQNIIDFVSRPDSWLENAEWYHLDEY